MKRNEFTKFIKKLGFKIVKTTVSDFMCDDAIKSGAAFCLMINHPKQNTCIFDAYFNEKDQLIGIGDDNRNSFFEGKTTKGVSRDK